MTTRSPNPFFPEEHTAVAAALAFDPDVDLEIPVPMPTSVSEPVRRALTTALLERFEYVDDLDAWLHAPDPRLDDMSPFEAIINGQAERLLDIVMVCSTRVQPHGPRTRGSATRMRLGTTPGTTRGRPRTRTAA